MNEEIEIARFFHRAPAESCGRALQGVGIPFRLSDDSLTPDISALGRGANQTCLVLVPRQLEVRARETLLEAARKEVASGVDPSHPLIAYDVDDLFEALEQPNEWSPYDLAVAEKLLRERGFEVPPVRYFPTGSKDAAVDQGNRPSETTPQQEPLPGLKSAKPFMTIFGFVVSTAGGIWGIIIASSYVFSTDTLPDGQKRWVYDPKSRMVGGVMFIYALLVLCVFVGWGLQNRLVHR